MPKKRVISDEAKAELVERLAKAREIKRQKNPNSVHYGIHPNVVAVPDGNPLSLNNVKDWIKTNKEIRTELRTSVRRNVKGAIAKLASVDGYIKHMEYYLRHGDWIDPMYGVDQQSRVKYKCVAKAYHPDGTVKRTIGTMYDDIGVYTAEMAAEDGTYVVKPSTKKRKKRAVR